MKHVELMTARDIIPVKVVELVVTSMEVVNRATADRYSIERYTNTNMFILVTKPKYMQIYIIYMYVICLFVISITMEFFIVLFV